MRGAISPLPNMPSWRGAQLKHRDNFTFTFIVRETVPTWKENILLGTFVCRLNFLYRATLSAC
jgi:hypothetical protein